MAIVSINTIKNWFKTGMIPTQDQFWSVFDSFRHKDDKVPVADVEGINELLATRASQQVLENHLAQKGAPNGYAPLDEFTKLAAQYLNIVNDLVTGGATALLSAEQGKVLQGQISAINTLLTSDNVNLDTVQELVDAIETVQLSLSSILVNDLTTGGTTKALTAEMGKQLDLIKESTANKSTSIVVDYLSNIKFPSVKAVYDFCMSAFKKKFLAFGDVAGIAHTFGVGSENTMFKFSNNNPITATIPTNATTPFEIGTVFETIAIGNGALTVTGAPGVTILTNLSNTSVKNEVRRYTKIDTDTWTVEGNNGKIQGTGVVYVSSSGNDDTGEVGNILKPFSSLTTAITTLFSNNTAFEIVIISTGTFTTSTSLRSLVKPLIISSNFAVVLNINSLGENMVFPITFNIPNGDLIFSQSIKQPFAGQTFFNIRAKNITQNTGSQLTEGGFNIEAEKITLNSSYLVAGVLYKSILKVGVLKFVGVGGFFQSYSGWSVQAELELLIDNIEHDSTFGLTLGNKTRLIIGNIYGTYTGGHFYFASFVGGVIDSYVLFKNSIISTNCSLSLNNGGNVYVTGRVKSLTSLGLFPAKSVSGTVFIENLIAECKCFLGANVAYATVLMGGGIIVRNCIIKTDYIFSFDNGGDSYYPSPTVTLEGENYITTTLSDNSSACIFRPNSGTPSLLINGVLKTNALLDTTKLTITKKFLNQYNSSTIIP